MLFTMRSYNKCIIIWFFSSKSVKNVFYFSIFYSILAEVCVVKTKCSKVYDVCLLRMIWIASSSIRKFVKKDTTSKFIWRTKRYIKFYVGDIIDRM